MKACKRTRPNAISDASKLRDVGSRTNAWYPSSGDAKKRTKKPVNMENTSQ